MRVLVAEDDPVSRKLLELHLKKWGYEVVLCSNGSEAWEILRSGETPPMVILDWMMPGKDGVDLCREIRKIEQGPYVYIILLTARNRVEDVVNGLEAGADDYIIKPFHPHELKVRVRAGSRVVQLQEDLLAALKVSKFQASHDSLTNLWNRAAVLEVLSREIARSRRTGTRIGVVIADADHFKRINDSYGHGAGDAVLVELARWMVSAVRPYDSVGRYGGEEFIMILPGASLAESTQMAERLRESLSAEPLRTAEGSFAMTMSFGVASFEQGQGWDVDSLIRAADAALYRAKNLGRNRVESWNEDAPPCLGLEERPQAKSQSKE
ncbi:MAG: diguanylate cyclase [Desulfomonile tiedjei]|nr:diguanylate cyclase [Desulfomonile tiedjei]